MTWGSIDLDDSVHRVCTSKGREAKEGERRPTDKARGGEEKGGED